MEDRVAERLGAKLWEWPLVVAYSLGEDVRDEALRAVVEQMDHSEKLAPDTAPGWCAMHRLGQVLTSSTDGSANNSALLEVERPLLAALEAGSLFAWGRVEPDGVLGMIEPSEWAGGEMIYGQACGLGPKGWRADCEDILGLALSGKQPSYWRHDVRLHGDHVIEHFGFADGRGTPIDHGEFADKLVFKDCEARAGAVREGYWSALVTLAWVVSRQDEFVSAVQLFEEETYGRRPGHTRCAAFTIGEVALDRFGFDLGKPKQDLLAALEAGKLPGSIGTDLATGLASPIERFRWNDWVDVHDHTGWRLLPGYSDCKWPSEEVRAAFGPKPKVEGGAGRRVTGLPRWATMKVSPEDRLAHRRILEFFDRAKAFLPDGEWEGATALRRRYVKFLKAHDYGKPLTRDPFNKWLTRYQEGWRWKGGGFVNEA